MSTHGVRKSTLSGAIINIDSDRDQATAEVQGSSENKLGARASKSTGGSFAARRKTEKSAPYRATTL